MAAQEIKFTSFGIPYITEFENVSFVPDRQKESRPVHPPSPRPRHTSPSPSPSSSSSSFCYIESPPPPSHVPSFSLRSASSLFKRKPTQHPSRTTPKAPLWSPISEDPKPPSPPPQPDPSETRAIFIRLPPEHSHPQTSRRKRLVHLQQIISVAVLDAGMSSSPGNTAPPEKHSSESTLHRAIQRYNSADALFCGTYGQLMTALQGAGLSAVPCVGEGLSGYTRLGALFVARNDGASGVQLRKITLWA